MKVLRIRKDEIVLSLTPEELNYLINAHEVAREGEVHWMHPEEIEKTEGPTDATLYAEQAGTYEQLRTVVREMDKLQLYSSLQSEVRQNKTENPDRVDWEDYVLTWLAQIKAGVRKRPEEGGPPKPAESQ